MSRKLKIILSIVVGILVISICIFWLLLGCSQKKDSIEKLRIIPQLTIELGSDLPEVSSFVSGHYDEAQVDILHEGEKITDVTDLSIGSYDVLLVIDGSDYLSKLDVVDTKGPNLVLKDLEINIGATYDINAFIDSCSDLDGVPCSLVYKDSSMGTFKDIGEYQIEIIAKDSSENETIEMTSLKIVDATDETTTVASENNSSNKTTKKTTSKNRVVDTIKEVDEDISYKYGVKIVKKTTTTYDIYADGSKKKVKTDTDTSYDYSTFNATTDDLKPEAESLSKSNSAKYKEVLGYVNQYRSEAGVGSLSLDDDLNTAATIRALEMAWTRTMSHYRPDGRDCFTVLRDLNITTYSAAENIAMGYSTPKKVSEGWKDSRGHYANMVNSGFTKIGIGYANVNGHHYWVQLFSG